MEQPSFEWDEAKNTAKKKNAIFASVKLMTAF